MPLLASTPINELPRAVIFDVGQVIIPVNMSRSFEALGKHRKRSHLQVLRELEADPRWSDWQEGRITPKDWHRHLAEKFQLSLSFDEFCRIWNSVLDPGTILPEQLFERMAKSCSLALLSNTDPIHVAHFEANYQFVRHFPVRVYSCRVGASKPAPIIYHHALRGLGTLPSETLYVDDVIENATAAAREGMIAFHFTSSDELLHEFTRLGLCES